MKVKLAVYIQNHGDGSCGVHFFNSTLDAEEYAKEDNERHCDDVYTITLNIDKNGKLLNPSTR